MIGAWERVLVLAPHTDAGEFGCGASPSVDGEGENGVVSPLLLSGARSDLSGAGVGAYSPEKGGPRGKRGFRRASSAASVVVRR